MTACVLAVYTFAAIAFRHSSKCGTWSL